jgi:hypothetical protein
MQDPYRRHRNDDHSGCDYLYCKQRRQKEYRAEETLFARAIFSELVQMGVNPAEFWGDGLEKALKTAERDIPDWLLQNSDDDDDDFDDDSHPARPEIDPVMRLYARAEISRSLAEQLQGDLRR